MEERIQGLMAEVLGIDREALLSGYDDRDIWESMQRVEVLFAMEEAFDIHFSEEELVTLSTPKALAEAVLRAVE